MILLRNIQLDGAPVNLFIEGSRIRRILPFPETDGLVADETVDGTGKAVIPGFINMHTHAAMIMLRGITCSGALPKTSPCTNGSRRSGKWKRRWTKSSSTGARRRPAWK